MSPEQARGEPVDKRADIWAFGCVLYEMLTGRRVFEEDTVSDTLAAALKTDPGWNALPKDTPRGLRKLLHRCLRRSAKERLQDIGDARIEIDDALSEPEELAPEAAVSSRQPALIVAAISTLAGLALGAVVAWWGVSTGSVDMPVRTFQLVSEDVLDVSARYSLPAISADGRRVAFASGGRLWIRDLDQLEPRELPGTEGARRPFWSPDGETVGYAVGRELRKIPAQAGTSTLICELPGPFMGGSWGAGGRIVLSTPVRGLFQVPATSGEPRSLAVPDRARGEAGFHSPQFLPDGETLIFRVRTRDRELYTLGLQTGGTRKVLLQVDGAVQSPVFSPSGHIVFQQDFPNRGIWAAPFSLSSLSLTGDPFLVVPDGIYPSVSADGTLVYVSGTRSVGDRLAWVDRQGNLLETFGQPHDQMRAPAISPDGRKVAVMGQEKGNRDIWVHDATRDTRTRLTLAPAGEYDPVWSPSGDRIAFVAEGGIFVKAADGSGEAEPLVTEEGPRRVMEPSWSRDGKYLAYTTNRDVWYLPLDAAENTREPVAFLTTAGIREGAARFSPDGRYLAYASEESGRPEVYVKPFPEGDDRWQVSVHGGAHPQWSGRGDEIFYLEENTLMVTSVRTEPDFSVGIPQKLFSGEGLQAELAAFGDARYDVAPDGERFVIVKTVFEGEPAITAIQNWPAILEKGR